MTVYIVRDGFPKNGAFYITAVITCCLYCILLLAILLKIVYLFKFDKSPKRGSGLIKLVCFLFIPLVLLYLVYSWMVINGKMEFYKAFDQFKLLHEICTCLFYPCYLLTLLYWIDKNLSKENPFMSEKENYISFTILFIPTFLVKIGCIVILGLKDNTTSHIHKILLSFYTGLIGVLMVLTLGILAYKKICHKFNSYKPMIHLFIISFTFMIYNLFYLFSTYTSQLPRIVHTVIYQALGPILLFLMLLLVYPIRNNLKQESKQDTSNATEMKKRIPPLKTETSINFGSETPRLHFEMGGEIGTPRGHFGIETPRNHAFSPETPREMEPLSASGRV